MVTRVPSGTPLGSVRGLDLVLLGGFRIAIDGEPIADIRSGRARALLAHLILHPGPHPRHRLASTFWPESSEGQARTNLRNVLFSLRHLHPQLDTCLFVTSDSLEWRPPQRSSVDMHRFLSAVDEAHAADPDDADEVIGRCRTAIELYTGDLLIGDLDEWILPIREELRSRRQSVLRLLVTALIDGGNPVDAIGPARDLVRADPLDETSHRLRMEAHRAAGDRAGAVRAFHECVASLDREIGVGPSAPTTALYRNLVEGPDADDHAPSRRTAPTRPGLVGRDTEWGQLIAAWESTVAGVPRVVMVTGEAGVGKTRLIDELQSWCATNGVIGAEARSYASEGDLGYGVLASWLRSPGIEAARGNLTPPERAELARLLPEIGSIGQPGPSAHGEERQRLFDAAVTALTTSQRPTLLVADDAQWSDAASQEFIHYLIRQPIDQPLMVVLAGRREDLDPTHPLTALRDAVAMLDRLTEIALDRLPRDATGALGRQLLGADLDDHAIDSLFAESEGNPLFIVETIRAGWEGNEGSIGLSPRLRAVINDRLRRLSDPAAVVTRTAAVIGRPCTASLLGELSNLDDLTLAQGLDELWRRGILCEVGADSYDFGHGKLRDAAYDALSPATRRVLHSTVADALAARLNHDLDVTGGQIAVHYEAANRLEEAVAWFHRAALDAQRMYAHAESVRLLDRALGLVPALAADSRHVLELELLSTMPLALAGIEGYGTTRMSETHRRASDVAANLGVDLDPSFVRSMVMSALCRDEFGDAMTAARRLLTHARAIADPGLAIEARYLLGISAFWAADLELARHHFTAVVDAFDPASRSTHHGRFGHDPAVVCLSRLANTLFFLGEDDLARATCERALTLATDVDNPMSHDTALVFANVLAVDLADHELLRRTADGLSGVRTDGVPFATKLEAVLGLIDVLDGDHTTGIQRGIAALDGCHGRNYFPGFQATLGRIVIAAHEAAEDAIGGLETATRILSLHSTPLWDPELHRLRAVWLAETGAPPAEVRTALESGAGIARDRGALGQLRRIEASMARFETSTSSARPRAV